MPKILRLGSCVRSRSGQGSQWNSFTFWGSGSIKLAAKSSLTPKALGECPLRILHAYEGHSEKVQGQGQVTKGHYKIKVTNTPCDTCFLDHVARRYRWQKSFDPMTSTNLTFDSGQVKVRSRSGQGQVILSNQCFFTQKAHVSCSEFPQDSKYVISFLVRCVEPPEIASKKWRHQFLAIYGKCPFHRNLVLFVAIVF